ncbi:glycoside hydrolase family 130 protein [Candidatus Auribacterota bacterium]
MSEQRIKGRDVVHRWKRNPIITPEDLSFSCLNIVNAGAVKTAKEYILLVRVETMKGYSVLVVARSLDGIHFILDKKPLLKPAPKGSFSEYEAQGVEDARITYLDNTYYIVYTAHSKHGIRLALAKTNDFKHVERRALISEADNKSGALFPKKIAGKYVLIERPSSGGNVWISYSPDLIHWGESKVLFTPRGTGFWDANRVGCAVPPIELADYWMVLYYGEKDSSGGPLFRLGAVLLKKDDPSVVLGRSAIPILSPRENYERIGDVGNLIFSCGAVISEDAQELNLYYGSSNSGICLGMVKIVDIVARCLEREGEKNGSI